jgi:hypothetical protein
LTNSRRKSDVLTIARDVLRRRGSARIIEITSTRGDVRGLLNEYRQFISESERQLARDGIRVTGTAIALL